MSAGSPFWVFRRGGAKRFTYAWAPDPNDRGKRKQTPLPEHIKTKVEAKRYALDHRAELEAERPEVMRSRGATIADLAERWEALIKSDTRKAWATIADHRSNLKKWIVPKFGNLSPTEIDAPMLRAWVRELRDKVAAYTCRNIVSTLASFLDDVAGEGWAPLLGNAARLKAVRKELPEARPRVGRSQKLRLKDVAMAQRLVDCAKIPLERRVRYAVVLTSGLRDGELSGLTWADIELDASVPHARIERALQLKSRDGYARPGDTKTEDSKRVFPLHPAAVAALRAWKDFGWEMHVTTAPRPTDHVFVKPDGSPWRPRSAEKVREDMKAAEIPTHVEGHALTFHALRRSFASWLDASEVPAEAISRLLGHVPRGTADRHYTEKDLGVLAGFVARIPIVWNGPTKAV